MDLPAPTLLAARLPDRALITVSGPDWRGFLQGLVSNDVETLGTGEMRFAALLTPQGKFLFDLFITGGEDGCRLDVDAARREALIQRLTMYRLRAKVEIAAVEGEVWAVWRPPSPSMGEGPGMGVNATELKEETLEAVSNKSSQPIGVLPPISSAHTLTPAPLPSRERGFIADPRLPALGWRGVAEAPPSGAVVTDADAHHAHRLSLGVPDPARDCVPDKTFPIEANFDLLNGIDFKKGCFVGQETTSRMKRRGQIRSRMLPLDFDGPPPRFGAEVLAGELRAGEVLSGRTGRAMALVRLDRIEDAALTVDGRAVTAVRPGWMGAA